MIVKRLAAGLDEDSEWAGFAIRQGSGVMATITKKELVNRIAMKTGQTKVITKHIIQLFLDEIIRELGTNNRLEFREFGVFEIKERAARKAQNPRTLQKVDVPAKRVVKFKVGRMMKQVVGMDDAAEIEALFANRKLDDDDDDSDTHEGRPSGSDTKTAAGR